MSYETWLLRLTWWLNKLSLRFCPASVPIPLWAAVLCLNEPINSLTRVLLSFRTSSSYTLEIDLWLRSPNSGTLVASKFTNKALRWLAAWRVVETLCSNSEPCSLNPASFAFSLVVKSTAVKNSNISGQGKYICPLSLYLGCVPLYKNWYVAGLLSLQIFEVCVCHQIYTFHFIIP